MAILYPAFQAATALAVRGFPSRRVIALLPVLILVLGGRLPVRDRRAAKPSLG